jgi:ligand-binding sensor domain-containing protein
MLILFAFVLGGCSERELPASHQDDALLLASEISTAEPERHISQIETVIFIQTDESNLAGFPYPNLWTRIDKNDITIYPYDVISDYTYDVDGSLWMVGGFGVLHRMPDGKQTVYSIKNGLSRQFFTRVAISPAGEVWVGGSENALFRFDGIEWIDEGEKLPPPYDDRSSWVCYSKKITGIDFGPDGSAWVMNGGIEIYTQVYGQWVNFPFPKEILPIAGGGGCPIGLRVLSEDNITIMRSGCCMGSPTGYRFDGEKWEGDVDYSVVEELLFRRHQVLLDEFYSVGGSIHYTSSVFADYLSFYLDKLLPAYLYPGPYQHFLITSDNDDVIWIREGVELYNNSTGIFETVRMKSENCWLSWSEDADVSQAMIVDFDTEIFYHQEERNPVWLEWVFRDSETGWIDASHVAVGKNGQIWVYSPQKGLILVDRGTIEVVDKIPDVLATSQADGVYAFQDGRIWIGSTGEIWEYQNGNWHQFIIPNTEELFTHFVEDDSGIVYGATDTGVYRFEGETFTNKRFMNHNVNRTLVESDEAGCDFHKYYSTCPMDMFDCSSGDFYKSVYLGIQDDGTVIYVNNRIVAKLENGKWESFFFNTFEIDSATVDKERYIWLFSHSDGLFRLDPDSFDAYQEVLRE